MRRMSLQRRRVVLLACSMASMSGVEPVLFRWHAWAGLGWAGSMVAALVIVLVLYARLRREEGQADLVSDC